MRINEDNFGVFYRAADILKKTYYMNIQDDTFEGWIEDEQVLTMIEDLCDEIDMLRSTKEENDYANEEADRERQVLGI